MGAPWTQQFIQDKIDFFSAAMETAATAQEYSYDQGNLGQFGLKKGDLAKTQRALDYWIAQMEKWYPDAFEQQPNISFTEIGFLSG